MSRAVRIERHPGARSELRPLFELAEDSGLELDGYIDAGDVLVAVAGGEIVGHLQLAGAEIKNMAVLPAHRRSGVGAALVAAAVRLAGERGLAALTVATAAADIGNLRFYQRQGFRMRSVERDAFTPATGYPEHLDVDGIELRDRVWLDRSVGRSSLFCDTAMAARLERIETELIAACNAVARRRADGFLIEVAGGVAAYGGPGSPFNKVAGLGFGGVPDEARLEEIEQAFAAVGSPVQIEVAQLADPELLEQLGARGYRLSATENVLGRRLSDPPEVVTPPGVELRASGDDELELWVRTVAGAAMHADDEGLPEHEEFAPDAIADAERDLASVGTRRYLALSDGQVAGGGGLRISDGVAQMAGAATSPEFRRRGIQTALLTRRLRDAAGAGCELAVVTTQPGSVSQRNVQRQGFELLYARAVLTRAARP
jgi:ribosomal protein S18 acetylase RimI-like enzyme